MMKRMSLLGLLVLPLALLAAPKNIIVMVPDGTGIASLTVAREVKGAPLSLDSLLCGSVQTRSASHIVTDSAAAGTAMSCGVRTRNGSIGVDAERVPIETFGEWAHAQGKAVGIVTTDTIVGATPAAFSVHATNRNDAEALFEQQIASGFEVYLGGGQQLLTKAREAYLAEQGYSLVRDKEALAAAQGKIFGLFAPGILTTEVERKGGQGQQEPSLWEMTQKALEVLVRDPDGFFLMVEGAQVDKGNHVHDLPWATDELLAFDEVVGRVVAWAQNQPDTLVVIAPDHETGGLVVHDEPNPDARAKALRQARAKGAVAPKAVGISYSTTWHSGTDVFLAWNRPQAVGSIKNADLPRVIAERQPRRLKQLHGTSTVEHGVRVLKLPNGTTLRAQRDAIYLLASDTWYARGSAAEATE